MDNRPAHHAILGLLKIAGGETHGYDLWKHFVPPDPFADILHIRQQTLYQYIKKLAAQGWITIGGDLAETGPGPVRQICRITHEGERELQRWMSEPVRHTRDVQLEFVVKLYFCGHLDPTGAHVLIEQQIVASTAWEHELETRIGRHADCPDGFAQTFRKSVLELRLDQTRSALAWLRSQRR